jgi:hypothetical protein
MGENRLPDCRQVDVADMSDRAADQDQTRVEDVDDSSDRVADELSGRSHQISYDWVAVCQSVADIGQRHSPAAADHRLQEGAAPVLPGRLSLPDQRATTRQGLKTAHLPAAAANRRTGNGTDVADISGTALGPRWIRPLEINPAPIPVPTLM